jgi:hypothetical protein
VLASHVSFTATGEEFDAKKIKPKTGCMGEGGRHDVAGTLFLERICVIRGPPGWAGGRLE